MRLRFSVLRAVCCRSILQMGDINMQQKTKLGSHKGTPVLVMLHYKREDRHQHTIPSSESNV